MSAQLGSAVLLGYGPQGVQQSGSALVLGYTPPPAESRRVAAGVHFPWGRAALVKPTTRAAHQAADSATHRVFGKWGSGHTRNRQKLSPWGKSRRTDTGKASPWLGPMFVLQPQDLIPWGKSRKTDQQRNAHWLGPLAVLQPQDLIPWGKSRAEDQQRNAHWLGPLAVLQPQDLIPWGKSRKTDMAQWIPWTRYSRQLSSSWMVIAPVDPGPAPDALFYILPARFYMTVHNLYAERLPDSADVPIYLTTIGADAGSFAWSFTASGPPALFDLLAPVDGLPAQIRIMVDGIAFVFAVESRRRSEKFGQRAVSIAGRSATALVGAPWQRETARSAAVPYTAQQLAAAALDLSGVALDWGLTDWLVPAGAWSHQGTPLAAVMAIAQAAGGYVLSHRSAPTLLTRHPYPTAPWSWGAGAADVEIAPDALITVAAEERGGNDINAVYASGTTTGVLARVLRTGTAGDKLAAMVTDPLITHVDAARQRGLAVLGAAGAKQAITLELPVLTGAGGDPGILDVGQLVQINAATPWRARVRAVSVSARMASVRQSVTLERHLEMEEV
ncbi:MAG: hypothetical protein IAE92_02515 [Burkholderiaceae bacterium]|nr:hypothetical protein [Burkholderiaceae bacterium]